MTFPLNAADSPSMSHGPESGAMMAPQSYRLARPGQRPLSFQGSELAMAMSFTPELSYWYEINIYRTAEQHFVLAIKLFFQSTDEADRCKAWQFETLPEVFDTIESYDAAQDVRVEAMSGLDMPAAELATHAYRLSATVASYRAHFASLVGEMFDEMDAAGQAA